MYKCIHIDGLCCQNYISPSKVMPGSHQGHLGYKCLNCTFFLTWTRIHFAVLHLSMSFKGHLVEIWFLKNSLPYCEMSWIKLLSCHCIVYFIQVHLVLAERLSPWASCSIFHGFFSDFVNMWVYGDKNFKRLLLPEFLTDQFQIYSTTTLGGPSQKLSKGI